MSYAISRYEQATTLLSMKWQRQAMQLPDRQKELAEELRLRAGQPMTVLLPDGEIPLGNGRESVITTDIEQLCDRITDYSRYAAAGTMARGYVTAAGGFRVGLCGTVVVSDGTARNLRGLSSAVIRIGKEYIGLSDDLLPQLCNNGHFYPTVIMAPPGVGKSTLLRDLIRNLSNGTVFLPHKRVGVVDERGEIAAVVHGIPQFNVGRHTDVIDGSPKAVGMEMLLRSCNPQVIAVDEITAPEDLIAMAQASNCGVSMLATIHADSLDEARRKPLVQKLLRLKVFEKGVVITRKDGRKYQVVNL